MHCTQHTHSVAHRRSEFGLLEIRWLMHWLRAALSGHFADVRHLIGDLVGQKESLVAAQQVG